jgi:hypothetical protein
MIQHGIKTIGDLKTLSSDKLPPIRGIAGMHRNATAHSLPGPSPNRVTDHRQAENPYQSKYGDRWQEQLKSCAALSPFRPISELVDFIAEESHRLMKGSVHEDNWFFYHDSLSLFTSRECRNYMERTECCGTTIFKKWLKPQNDINKGTIYHGRYVGNSPEFIPLDNSLNYDLQLSHKYHCAVTAHLADTDKRKFSLSTPLRITRGIKKSGNMKSVHLILNV